MLRSKIFECLFVLLLPPCLLGKYVELSLDSSWQETPLLLEACEFFRRQEQSQFWNFLEYVSKNELNKCNETEDCIKDVLESSKIFLSEDLLKVLRIHLELRLYSPAVQSMRMLASSRSTKECFVDFGDENVVDDPDMLNTFTSSFQNNKIDVLKNIDLFYSNTEPNATIAVLYCFPSLKLLQFHTKLKRLATNGTIRYTYRPNFPDNERKTRLIGYGVEMQMKSTEYKTRDENVQEPKDAEAKDELTGIVHGFDFDILKERNPNLKDKLLNFKRFLLVNESSILELKPWQVQSLSSQTAQLIMQSEDPVVALREYSQNFLLHLKEISQSSVSPENKRTFDSNLNAYRMTFNEEPSQNEWLHRVLINGRQVDYTDLFSFIELISSELKLVNQLKKAGVRDNRRLRSLLYRIREDDLPTKSRNSFTLDFRSDSIVWLNDLERDKEYQYWSSRLFDLVNNIPFVKKNIYHLVAYIDAKDILSSTEETINILNTLENLLDSGYPLRLGVVVVPRNREHSEYRIVQVMRNLPQNKRLQFLTAYAGSDNKDLGEVLRAILGKRQMEKVLKEETLGSDNDKTLKYFISTGLGNLPQLLFNGRLVDHSDGIEERIRAEYMLEKSRIRDYILRSEITDRTPSIINFLMTRPEVRKRINYQVMNSLKTVASDDEVKGLLNYSSNAYMTKDSEFEEEILMNAPLTVWLAVNPECSVGKETLSAALFYMKKSDKIRLSLLLNPSTERNRSEIIKAAILSKQSQAATRRFLLKYLQNEDANLPNVVHFNLNKLERVNAAQILNSLANDADAIKRYFKGLEHGQNGIIVNGRIICPLQTALTEEDFTMLMEQMLDFSEVLIDELSFEKHEATRTMSDDLVRLNLVLLSQPQLFNRRAVSFVPAWKSKDANVSLQALVFVDPASESAQELSPMLEYIRPFTHIQLFWLCRPMLSELPIKRLYRLALNSSVRFDKVPSTQLFSLNVIPSHAWMISAVEAEYDLDNIRLSEVSVKGISARFELEYLLIEGQCIDQNRRSYARGLELSLSSYHTDVEFDTIVMANLGYFQLKSFPGVWIIQPRPGNKRYEMKEPVVVISDSLTGHIVTVYVQESKNKTNSNRGFWSSLVSSVYPNKKKSNESEVVNIFSIASGHLYERFLRIMMLSVLKHKKNSKIKFWFLKNFLSPGFVKFLPKYAEAYGFEFELVQYKWPRWLTVYPKQKQRVIWGYKILFLDVLFPLDVKRIIFVDADQVARTDMSELYRMDLQGAPYGYTPFCDSRKDMDGYRFWKSGYWASHLGNRKYHISALYVVDLQLFRAISAGDRLRGQYFALSQDPNSLANLDQDLPNNMIHQVDIFSLPQEWLWCETWCDDQSKAKAKTIDLCNNPMTKEPKLQSARRIIEEWDSYDKEIKAFMERKEEKVRDKDEL